MRFLCLHGAGTNTKIFEMQTAAIRYALGDHHTYEFVEGSVPCEPAPGTYYSPTWPLCTSPFEYAGHVTFKDAKSATGIDTLASSEDGFFEYIEHGSQASFAQALDELEDYIAEAGPFDAVMAFSQGAGLAAALIIRRLLREPIQERLYPMFKCGIFFCGASPGDPALKLEKDKRLQDLQEDGEIIDIPTAHIWGKNDRVHPTSGPVISRLCKKGVREDFIHDGGHEIPGARDSEAVTKSLRIIKRTLERTLNAQ